MKFDPSKHHSSCKPGDAGLVWHCGQCGLMTPAEEEEPTDTMKRAGMLEILHAEKGAGEFEIAERVYKAMRAALAREFEEKGKP